LPLLKEAEGLINTWNPNAQPTIAYYSPLLALR